MQRDPISPAEVWLQAAIDSGGWRKPLAACASYLGANAVLLAWDAQAGGVEVESSPGSSPELVRLCRGLAHSDGADVLERQQPGLGLLNWTGAQGGKAGSRVTLFALSGEPVARQPLRTLAVSAASAVTMRANLDAMRMTTSLMTQACDQLRIGLVTVDAGMNIVAHNQSWRLLIARCDGLSALGGKLVCRDRGDQTMLAAAVIDVLAGRLSEATVKAGRAGGAEPYVLRATTAECQSGAPGHCLLMVVDPDEAPAPNGDIWRTMFELTECELIIAEGLISGRRISEVAARRGVSRETVRSQTKRMFARLGVSSQVEAAVRLSRATPFRALPARSANLEDRA
jgi:DNA-binding NarL/FixJ family response regulator